MVRPSLRPGWIVSPYCRFLFCRAWLERRHLAVALVVDFREIEAVEDQYSLQRGNDLGVAPLPHDRGVLVELEQLHAGRAVIRTVALPICYHDVAVRQ